MIHNSNHSSPSPTSGLSVQDRQLVDALRQGDEKAFEAMVNRFHSAMLRLALIYVPGQAVAEEVIQETWIGVLRGLEKFEGRSSLKTWIMSILVNKARTQGQREGRYALSLGEMDEDEPAVDPTRFYPSDHPASAHEWSSPLFAWDDLPEENFMRQEVRHVIQKAIDGLPAIQREVITLRDIEQWTTDEVCHTLNISDGNQRVLLHRARSKVRQALEQYFMPQE